MSSGSSSTQKKTSDVSHCDDQISVMQDSRDETLVPVQQKSPEDINSELYNKSLHHSEIPENSNPGETISKVDTLSKNGDQVKAEKLTDIEVQMKRQSFLDKVEGKLLSLKNILPRNPSEEGAPFTHSFRECIIILSNSYFNFKREEVPYQVIVEHQDQVGKALIKHGAVEIICDVLVDALKKSDFVDKDGKPVNDLLLPIKIMASILLNYSDNQNYIKIIITDHKELLPLMLKFLKENQQGHLEKTLHNELEQLCDFFLTIVYNCGALQENVPKLRELNVIPVTLTFLDSPDEHLRLMSISLLANLVNEKEARLLRANVSIFKFLLKNLDKALNVERHKHVGWSAQELTRAVRQLSRNDANKEILVREGCLTSLVKLLDVGNDLEVEEAIYCMWTLSFNDDNKKKMVAEPHLVEKVYNSYRNSTQANRQAFQGVLWSLRYELFKSEQFKSIGEEITNLKSAAKPKPSVLITSPETSIFQGHVMISYQWANQEVIKKICQELRAHGVPVWLDIDFMHGSTIQAMAEAVEDSCIVIMAMSQLYKDSPNTRAEAEYTFQCRKTIIPLNMQIGYHPDGWLGLLLGTKIYYDFSGKVGFRASMDGLIKAVMKYAYVDSTDSLDQDYCLKEDHRKPKVDEERLKTWTKEDIYHWLAKHSLQNSAMQHLSCKEIIFLFNIKHEAPEFFYRCLESKMNLTSLQDLASASEAFLDMTMI